MNFDTPVDRRGTGSLKWNLPTAPGQEDTIPLWVADMDFAAPEVVTRALRARVEHPIYGYTIPDSDFLQVLSAWYLKRYGARVPPEHILLGPGVVPSLGIAARTFAKPEEGVLIMPPVYYPFAEAIRSNGRQVVEAPLKRGPSGRLEFDPGAAEAAVDRAEAAGTRVVLAFLCSPHNPGGTVWTPGELEAFLDFAKRRDLIVVADEIHGDLVFSPARFTSLADLPGAQERTLVISTANKTFNIAGLHLSHFVVRDDRLRERARAGLAATGYSQPNIFSMTAAKAAYAEGGPWLDELLGYLGANIEYTVAFLRARVPGLEARAPEGTYLVWADARGLLESKGLRDDKELVGRLEAEARVKLTAGSLFGRGGEGFVRINIACPRSQLTEGLERLERWAAT